MNMEASAIINALLDGDTDKAITLLSEMSHQGRHILREAAGTMRQLTHPENWCGGCGWYVDTSDGLAKFYKPDGLWHRDCWLRSSNNHQLVETAYEQRRS